MFKYIFLFFFTTLSLIAQDPFAEAKALEFDKDFTFKIEKKGGSQFLKFTLKETAYLRFFYQKTKGVELEPRAAFYNIEKKNIGEREMRLEKGDYFLQVYDQWNDQFSPLELTGKLEFFPEMDAGEVDSFEKPRVIQAGDKFSYAIMPIKDVDFFKFTATETGYIKIILDKSAVPNLDSNGQIFNEQKQLIGNLEARVVKGETYLIQIFDQWSDQSAPKVLTGEFKFFPEVDVHELNDSLDNAKDLAVNSPTKLTLMPLKDRDFFKISVPAAGAVLLSISTPLQNKNLSPSFRIYNADKELVGNSNTLQTMGPATLYVEIFDRWGNESSVELLTLNYNFVEEKDLNEPNNQPFMAIEVNSNDLVQGAIFPTGDVDFFAVSIEKAGYLTLQNLSSPKDLNLLYQLCDSEGKVIPNSLSPHFKVSPGKYLLKATANYGSSSQEFYSFNPIFLEEFDELEKNEQVAVELTTDKFYNSAIFPKNDVDFWSVTLKATGILEMQYFGTPANFYHSFDLLNEKDEVLFKNAKFPLFLAAGQYKFKAWGSQETPAGFKMNLRFKESLDTYEFNNNFMTAKALNLHQDYTVYLEVVNDEDFFKFSIKNEENVSFYANDEEINQTRQLWLQVYDAKQKMVPPLKTSSGKWFGKLPVGEYYLRLLSDQGRAVPILLNGFTGEMKPSDEKIAVAVVGLKLNEKESELVAKIAENSGSLYINSDETTDINKAVEKAVVTVVKNTEPLPSNVENNKPGNIDEPTSKPKSIINGILPIALLFIGLVVIYFIIKNKRPNEQNK